MGELRHAAGRTRERLARAAKDGLLRGTRLDRLLAREFHGLYYFRHDQTHDNTFWLGRRTQKCPLDLWIYQEILAEQRPSLIVETGTYHGGSALYLAALCDLLAHGQVVSIDVAPHEQPAHPRVTYLTGSSIDPAIVEQVRDLADGPVLVLLDSDHTRDHVRRELALYSDLVTPGSYLIVEDTNLNGHPAYPRHGPGPMEAVKDFLAHDDRFTVDRTREKFMLTFNPNGYLRRVR